MENILSKKLKEEIKIHEEEIKHAKKQLAIKKILISSIESQSKKENKNSSWIKKQFDKVVKNNFIEKNNKKLLSVAEKAFKKAMETNQNDKDVEKIYQKCAKTVIRLEEAEQNADLKLSENLSVYITVLREQINRLRPPLTQKQEDILKKIKYSI